MGISIVIEAMISIKPRHVSNIIDGSKLVELRTKRINMPIGSKLWIYSTLPVGMIEVSARIQFIETLSPDAIWTKYGRDICIAEAEFKVYTKGRDVVTAIGLIDIEELRKKISLKTLRHYEEGFQPPQFISKLYPERAIYNAFYG